MAALVRRYPSNASAIALLPVLCAVLPPAGRAAGDTLTYCTRYEHTRRTHIVLSLSSLFSHQIEIERQLWRLLILLLIDLAALLDLAAMAGPARVIITTSRAIVAMYTLARNKVWSTVFP
jgi:hypothetical protein